MADSEIIFFAKGAGIKQSDSGIRTRRAELVDDGIAFDTGATITLPSGRKSILWNLRPEAVWPVV
jgi:hypothetical protein